MEVTRSPQALRSTPTLLAVTPFPNPLTTPPVTSTYFIFFSLFLFSPVFPTLPWYITSYSSCYNTKIKFFFFFKHRNYQELNCQFIQGTAKLTRYQSTIYLHTSYNIPPTLRSFHLISLFTTRNPQKHHSSFNYVYSHLHTQPPQKDKH